MASFCREWVQVGRLITKVVSYGGSVESKPKKLVLIFPGNPGIASYYEEFMETLYDKMEEKCPVWAVGHGGHDCAGQEHLIPSRPFNRELFSLQGQIRHKVDFIKTYVPAKCHAVLIGHSIGCKLCIEVMKHFDDDDNNVDDRTIRAGYLLFPTIERMYESPQGLLAWIQTAYLFPLVIGLAWLLRTLLPRSALQSVVRWALSLGRDDILHPSVFDATCDLVNPVAVGNVLYMAYTELLEVRELDEAGVRRFNDRLRFYFGSNDHWCPVQYYHDMVKRIPEARAQVCQKNLPHAFVLGSSVEAACQVAKWFHDDKPF